MTLKVHRIKCVCGVCACMRVRTSENCFKDNVCLLFPRNFENCLLKVESEGVTINILLLYQGDLGLGTSLSPIA